jgi:hypothetical protein
MESPDAGPGWDWPVLVHFTLFGLPLDRFGLGGSVALGAGQNPSPGSLSLIAGRQGPLQESVADTQDRGNGVIRIPTLPARLPIATVILSECPP